MNKRTKFNMTYFISHFSFVYYFESIFFFFTTRWMKDSNIFEEVQYRLHVWILKIVSSLLGYISLSFSCKFKVEWTHCQLLTPMSLILLFQWLNQFLNHWAIECVENTLHIISNFYTKGFNHALSLRRIWIQNWQNCKIICVNVFEQLNL